MDTPGNTAEHRGTTRIDRDYIQEHRGTAKEMRSHRPDSLLHPTLNPGL